ncbi:MAG: hypothetical protein U5K69_24340 [Balneolaceae bacterium]|nr:hypothetical protein [Balneolaceae bacterium]
MDRVINYAFLLLLIFLFVLDATVDERVRVGLAIVLAVIFSYLVFY